MVTGCNPGAHGLLDYLLVEEDHSVRSVNSSDWRRSPVWEIAGREGARSVVMGMPITYPPRQLNGVMVTDMMSTPGPTSQYTYPREVKRELLKVVDGSLLAPDERNRGGDPVAFITDMSRSVRRRGDAAVYLRDRYEWDLLAVVLYALDMLQHELWHVLVDTTGSQPRGPVAEALDVFFRQLDDTMAALVRGIRGEFAVVLASDHGGAAVDNFLHVNTWLLKHGYLRLRKTPWSAVKFAGYRMGATPLGAFRIASRLGLGRFRRNVRMGRASRLLSGAFLSLSDVDWPSTKAFSVGNFGQVYVNRADRFVGGPVERTAVCSVAEEIAAELAGLRYRDRPVVRRVLRKEVLYQGDAVSGFPELLLEPEGFRYLCFGETAFGGNRPVEPIAGMSGFHSPEGIVAIRAPGVPAGRADRASIMDVGPTVLGLLGVPAPDWMEGRELVPVSIPRRHVAPEASGPAAELSPQEQEALKRRLKGLGYAG
jgi:predicted AlkP superfamily phosphohydrolase/phosphomutase